MTLRDLFPLVLLTLAVAPPVAAQESPQSLQDVYACAQTTDDAARLACYDATVGRLHNAEQEGRVVAVDREQVATLERESFGFQFPSLGALLPRSDNSSASPNTELVQVQARIARVVRRSDDRYWFEMENGQIWGQIEPQSAANIRAGDTVTIRRATLGSFFLSPARHGAAHRVRRID